MDVRSRSYTTCSRSPSPKGNKSRNRSDNSSYDSYSDYSDSFVSDSESESIKKRQSKNVKAGKKRTVAKGKRDARTSKSTPRITDPATRHMLSVRRVKLNDYKNEIEDLRSKLHDMCVENKTLKRQSHLQNRALEKYEGQENELPHLIQSHLEETRVLKEQLKRQKEKHRKVEERLKQCEHDLSKQRKHVQYYKKLVNDKNLKERNDLSEEVSKLESVLEEKDRRVKDLEKHIENLSKNHRHQLGVEGARHRDTERRLLEQKEENNKLQAELKEKLKELEVRNIYAKRLIRAPHKLPSTLASSSHSTPLPQPAGKRRKNSEPCMTPREKAKLFELKRREKRRHRKEELENEKKEIEREIQNESKDVTMVKEQENQSSLDEALKEKELQVVAKEIEDKNLIAKEHKEDLFINENVKQEHKKTYDESDDLSDVTEIMDSDEKENERKAQEEKEHLEQEQKRQKEFEQEMKKQKELQEQERKKQKELQEEMRRQRELQEQKRKLQDDEEERKRRLQKDLLLAKMGEIDSKKETFITQESHNTSPAVSAKSKAYSFTEAIENMHKGKPSNENVRVPVLEKRKKSLHSDDSSSDGGYHPSFLPKIDQSKKKNSVQKTQPKKKGDLMKELFGESAKTDSSDTRVHPSGSHGKNSYNVTVREKSNTVLLGGGAAFIDSNNVSSFKKAQLLP